MTEARTSSRPLSARVDRAAPASRGAVRLPVACRWRAAAGHRGPRPRTPPVRPARRTVPGGARVHGGRARSPARRHGTVPAIAGPADGPTGVPAIAGTADGPTALRPAHPRHPRHARQGTSASRPRSSPSASRAWVLAGSSRANVSATRRVGTPSSTSRAGSAGPVPPGSRRRRASHDEDPRPAPHHLPCGRRTSVSPSARVTAGCAAPPGPGTVPVASGEGGGAGRSRARSTARTWAAGYVAA